MTHVNAVRETLGRVGFSNAVAELITGDKMIYSIDEILFLNDEGVKNFAELFNVQEELKQIINLTLDRRSCSWSRKA